ncbi:MAG: Exo-poly-alpha-D-galacturonosidase precursor [Verrucomicrobiota bacterium]|jgi:hypothetical protein
MLTRRHFVAQLTTAAGTGLALGANPLVAATGTPASATGTVAVPPAPGWLDVRAFGARGDGATLDTAALQAAIDACTAAGGGTVFFPAGRFLSGTLTLKNNVTLHLSPGATLLGSQDTADYPAKPFGTRDLDVGGFDIWALLYADGAHNIAIEGRGLIDGNGKPFRPLAKIQPLDVASGPRPRGIFLKDSHRVTLRDFSHRNSGLWAVHLARCEQVALDNLRLHSEHFVQQDGIIIDSSRDVRVSNCSIHTIDDALVFKSSYPVPSENIAVTNCVLTCESSAIKFGTQSLGGFRNIAISNCALHNCRLGGLKFEAIDGGTLEDVTVSNIAMFEVSAPLFFKLNNRARDFGHPEIPQPQPIGRLRNIVITGLRSRLTPKETFYTGGAVNPAERRGLPYRTANTVIIAGLPGHPIENVSISDVHFTFAGGGIAAESERFDIPEEEKRYPENDMFGILPCWGFYLRHARSITLNNVRLDLLSPDARSVLVADDVTDLEINGLKTAGGAKHCVRLRAARDVRIHHSRLLERTTHFLDVQGGARCSVVLVGNDLRLAATPVTLHQDSAPDAVVQQGNVT